MQSSYTQKLLYQLRWAILRRNAFHAFFERVRFICGGLMSMRQTALAASTNASMAAIAIRMGISFFHLLAILTHETLPDRKHLVFEIVKDPHCITGDFAMPPSAYRAGVQSTRNSRWAYHKISSLRPPHYDIGEIPILFGLNDEF